MESSAFNDKFRQVVLFGIIIVIALLLFFQLTTFLPGLLGGFTIYVLSRSFYFKLTEQKKWKKGAAALLLMFLFLVLIALPVYAGFLMLSPKINQLASQQDKIINGFQVVRGGERLAFDDAIVRETLSREVVDIDVALGVGDGEARAYGCDLTKGYVEENAAYYSS